MAGLGLRLGSVIPKQFLPLGKRALYEHALTIFKETGFFDEIILVCPEGWQVEGSILGGSSRQESCYQGLLACGDKTDYVVIHDGTRPFITKEILERHIEMLGRYPAINTCIPSYDTLNQVEDGRVIAIPDRSTLMRGQTPQSFSYPLLLKAHENHRGREATDDCALMLAEGHPVHYVLGSETNHKITTPSDLIWAEMQIEQEVLKAEKQDHPKRHSWQNSIFTTLQ